jgi:periplasmic protein TonB
MAARTGSDAVSVGPGRADPGNVVPFIRPQSRDRANGSAADVVLRPGGASSILPLERRIRFACLFAISLLVHGGLFAAAFLHEPKPLASIGLEAMSVELVLGAVNPAGLAASPGENEVQSQVRDNEPQQETQSEPATTAQQQDVPTDRREMAPQERPVEGETTEAKVEESQPAEPAPREPAVAMVETPQAEVPTSSSPPPSVTEVTLVPRLDTKPTVAAKPRPAAKPAPVQTKRQPVERAEKRTRVAARTIAERPDPQTTRRSTLANASVGVGRSDVDTNYVGLVGAHLARHKQYPADARSRGDQGTATVAFSLDGSGRVTSVRLARGSGVASLDQEVQAMVRRANPFPAPPSGRSVSFTRAINFRQN